MTNVTRRDDVNRDIGAAIGFTAGAVMVAFGAPWWLLLIAAAGVLFSVAVRFLIWRKR